MHEKEKDGLYSLSLPYWLCEGKRGRQEERGAAPVPEIGERAIRQASFRRVSVALSPRANSCKLAMYTDYREQRSGAAGAASRQASSYNDPHNTERSM